MGTPNSDSVAAYGLNVLLGSHSAVRQLKQKVRPTEHGHKVWTSSWLLVDYLSALGVTPGLRLLDLGCGWGLAGIYGAKRLAADVIWADLDDAVEPYLELMARTNGIRARFLPLGIEQVRRHLLGQLDIIVASDICFCDTLIDPLRRLINRAKAAKSVRHILIADPGRWPFDDLCELMSKRKGVSVVEHQIEQPKKLEGKILKITL